MVMHSCDTPACVNPEHLSVGSGHDNAADAVRKRRHAFGERNKGGGKLTWADARDVRATAGKIGCTTMARLKGVSVTTIKGIRRGRLWRADLDPGALA